VAGVPAVRQTAPQPRTRRASGLARRAGSGRARVGLQASAGQEYGPGVVMKARQQIGRRHGERGRKINGDGATEAIAAAGKSLVVPVLVLSFVFAVMVGMPLGAGRGMNGVQMKRGMGIAARQRERQQHDQAAQEERPLHGTITELQKVGQNRNPA